MSQPGSGGQGPADASPAQAGLPIRVTTLELFFDLVFAFTLTQLTALLSDRLTLTGTVQVLMIFAALWWMYGGYVWLTNARPPVHATERLLMLVAMAGFLTAGLAIPRGFGADGVAFGLGFLVVTLVHGWLYYRVNANIIRIAPFRRLLRIGPVAIRACAAVATAATVAAGLAATIEAQLAVVSAVLAVMLAGERYRPGGGRAAGPAAAG